MISKFNGTSTPKGSYSAKTGVKLPYECKQSPLEKNVWSNECKVQGKMSRSLGIIQFEATNY